MRTSPDLESQYLRDALWRDQNLSRQVIEQIKGSRGKLDRDDVSPDTKKEVRRKISSLNRRLKRCQMSVKAMTGNLATLGPSNQVMTQNWTAESEYSRRFQAIQTQSNFDLQNQIQQLSLAAQNSPSPRSSMNSPVPTSLVYLWSPVAPSEGCSPLCSPFYDTSFQPFNYISGQFTTPSPLRRYSASISPTEMVQLDAVNFPMRGLGQQNGLLHSSIVPMAIEAKTRSMSLPLIWYKPREESKLSDSNGRLSPGSHRASA
jgi:hypothetical protein